MEGGGWRAEGVWVVGVGLAGGGVGAVGVEDAVPGSAVGDGPVSVKHAQRLRGLWCGHHGKAQRQG